MRKFLIAAALVFAAPISAGMAFAQIPVPQVPRSGPVLPPDAPRPPQEPTAPTRPTVTAPTRPQTAQLPTDPALARQPIEALETDMFGACAQNNRAITRVSGGEAQPRIGAERQMRDRGIRAYRYVYRATGCGLPARRHNIEILARENQPPVAVALPMGTTVTTSMVLNGVYDSLFTPMMREQHAGCDIRRLKIREANVTSGEPYVRNGNWTETWAYDACGVRGNVVITFVYDGDGLQMSANATLAEE